jgi:hypothetical protein
MVFEARAADADGLVKLACLAQLLGELREGDRRRVFVDPAPQVVKPGSFVHRPSCLLS